MTLIGVADDETADVNAFPMPDVSEAENEARNIYSDNQPINIATEFTESNN